MYSIGEIIHKNNATCRISMPFLWKRLFSSETERERYTSSGSEVFAEAINQTRPGQDWINTEDRVLILFMLFQLSIANAYS